MLPSLRALVASLALPLLLAGPLGAQETVLVPDTPICVDCLELEVVLSFGFADDEGALLTRYPAISRLPNGGWVVFESTLRGVIRIYNPDGSFQRAIEARGEGPGEYRGLSRIMPDGDDGYVLYDLTGARLSYVADDFSFLHSSRFLPATRIEALSDGSFVVNATLPRTVAQGHVVNVVDSAGSVRASFGGSGRPIDLRIFHARHRLISVDPSDKIWTGYIEKYQLEKYSADGRLLRSISRIADWFRPHTEIRPPRDANSDPPNPMLREITVANDGRIWAMVWVAGPDWREGLPPENDPVGRYDDDKTYDTVLESIDPENGRVVARTRADYALRKVHIAAFESEEPLYFRTIQQDDGFIRADILRPVFR